jgi:hypothetical protein
MSASYAADSTATEATPVEQESGQIDLKGWVECRRNAGLAAGIVYTGQSWEFVGQNGPLALTGSPIFGMMCDGGGDKVAFSFGIDSAPFYVQRAAGNQFVEQWLTASVGLVMGNQTWRYGVLGSAGLGYYGAGLRGLWMPWVTKKGARRGFELRTIAWFSGQVGLQASLQFHMTARKRAMPFRRKK